MDDLEAQTEIKVANDEWSPIETLTLAEFENQLLNNRVGSISERVLFPGTNLPKELEDEIGGYKDQLRRARTIWFETFQDLKGQQPTFYQQLLPALYTAFRYGIYDFDYWPKLPKVMVREIRFDGNGLPTFDVNRRYVKILRRPNEVEFALGIFVEEVDPLIRGLVVSLAEKGYRPACSCQGHPRFSDKGGVSCDVELSKSIIEFLQSRGAHVGRSRYADIDIPHGRRYPLEFLKVTQTLGDELPQIDESKFLDTTHAVEFRNFYNDLNNAPPISI